MQYTFRGTYDSTLAYSKLDVVMYQPTTSSPKRFYLCLTDHNSMSPQVPIENQDSEYWGVLNSDSNFPQNIDSFITRSAMSSTDKVDYDRYKTLMEKTSLTTSEQNELTTLSDKLRNKLILSEDWNKLQSALQNLQFFFMNEVDGKISQTYDQFEAKVEKFDYRGSYSSTTTYNRLNTVTYNFQTYICLKDGLVNVPPSDDGVNWRLIAQRGEKGEKGDKGANLRFLGEWSSTTTYIKDDAVRYDGRIYAALQTTTGNQPTLTGNEIYWELAVDRGREVIVSVISGVATVTTVTSNVPIAVTEYNLNSDALIVVQNGITLAEGVNYAINANGTSIDNLEGSWDGTTDPITFNFIVIKNFVADMSYADGTLIADGTVPKTKLQQVLQDEINSKATKTELGTTNTNLSNHTGDTSIHKTSSAIRTESSTELRVEVRTSDPSNPAVGRIWFRSDL